jgi:hypothetical protein
MSAEFDRLAVFANGGEFVWRQDGGTDFNALRADLRLLVNAKDMLEALYQYESDLLYPPTGDSRDRRLERVRAVITKAEQVSA